MAEPGLELKMSGFYTKNPSWNFFLTDGPEYLGLAAAISEMGCSPLGLGTYSTNSMLVDIGEIRNSRQSVRAISQDCVPRKRQLFLIPALPEDDFLFSLPNFLGQENLLMSLCPYR